MKSKGLTLIELVLTIAILGIVSGMIASILSTGFKINNVVTIRNDVQGNIRTAMVKLTDDLRKGVEFIDNTEFSINNLDVKPSGSSTKFSDIIKDSSYIPLIYIKQLNNKLDNQNINQTDIKMCLYAYKKVGAYYNLYKINLKYANASIIYNYYNDNSDMYGNIDFSHISPYITDVDAYEATYFNKYYKVNNVVVDNIDFGNGYSLVSDNSPTPVLVSSYGFSDEDPSTINFSYSLPANFYYYQRGDIYRCMYYTNSSDPTKSTFRSIKLIPKLNNFVELDPSDYQLVLSGLESAPVITLQDGGKIYKVTLKATEKDNLTGITYSKDMDENVVVGNYGGNNND
jgi:prepilin-type N-terminal cleavage/methylation domain-containing protein